MGNFKGIQFGESATADFEENTWTFEMPEGYRVVAGEFAIMPKNEYLELLEQKEKYFEFVRRITNQIEDIGREGCTYGDTHFDSLSVVYGYNLSVNQMKDAANELINKIQNG